jgi:hypothetical protein
METKLPKENPRYCCDYCGIITNNKKDYTKHLLTAKHTKLTNVNKQLTDISHFSQDCVINNCNTFICDICEKTYKSRVGLWKHKKQCFCKEDKESLTPFSSDKELIMMLIKQNAELMEIVKNGTNNTTNNTNTNCMNKTFNLQFFLNETCKDAMNIMDFVDSIKLQLSDLERYGEVGYVENISNIITTNLKALDVSQRPVHCTDRKRETIYIKDENKWEKADDNNSKLRTAIRRVANKNIKLLPQYREKYPGCQYADSKYSDKYNKTVVEAMGGAGNNDVEKEDKIIHNISKNVVIEK